MGLIEREITELRQIKRDYELGKIDEKKVNTFIAIYSQSEKRSKLMLQSYALSAKFGARTFNRLKKSNLIGDHEAINTGLDAELEMVKCPDQENKLICRTDCLDYSGSAEHMEGCKSCDQYKITRKRLLP